LGFTLIASLAIAGVAYGMRYWAERARRDRSALVGLYLIHGIISSLLTVAGLALAVNGRTGGWVILAVGLGIGLPLFRPVRQVIARFTPMDPTSPIDASGLSIVIGFTALLGGLALLTPDPDDVEGSVDYWLLAAQALLFVSIALACVGLGFRRTAAQTAQRLGLVPIRWRPLLMVLAFLVLCFVVNSIGGVLTQALQPDFSDDIDEGLEELTADVQSPAGAVALGASAGIGEELLFRGALQPRFGIFITSLLFALSHTNYGLSFITLGVFLMGVVLGYQRQRYGTTYAIITHAVFNFIVVLARASA